VIKRIEKAIKRIHESKTVHELWLEYFKKYPHREKHYAGVVHGIEGQKEIIQEYNDVLELLYEVYVEYSES